MNSGGNIIQELQNPAENSLRKEKGFQELIITSKMEDGKQNQG